MKKFGTVLLTIGMLAVVCAPATYADAYRPSVTAKAAPAVTANKIVDKDGNVTELAEDEVVVVTPLSETAAETVSEEVKAALTEAATDLAVESLEEVEIENIDAVIAVVAENKTAADFEVRDLFDVAVPEKVTEALNNGGSYTATFAAGVDADTALVVMTKCPGAGWVAVPAENVVNNGDGTVTVTFTALCPIAFLSEKAEEVIPEEETAEEPEEEPEEEETVEEPEGVEETEEEPVDTAEEEPAVDNSADEAEAAPAEEAPAAADAETNPNSGVDFGTTMLYIAGAALAMAGAAVLGFTFRKASKTK